MTTTEILAAPAPARVAPSRGRRRRTLGRNLAIGWIGLVTLLAVFADLLPLKAYEDDVGLGVSVAPFHTWSEPFGTDAFGRSVLSRLIFGARVSLFAAVSALAIAIVVGVTVGVVAGYVRGILDSSIGVVVDAILAFPGIMMLMVLAAVLQPSIRTIVVGLSIFGCVSFARVSRANTMRIATEDFVAASRGLGARPWTVLWREILPNISGPILAMAPLVMGGMILAEASLSFLGLGVRPPAPSWGNMIADGRRDLRTHAHLVFVPAVVLFVTIFAVNFIGESLRSRSDGASRV